MTERIFHRSDRRFVRLLGQSSTASCFLRAINTDLQPDGSSARPWPYLERDQFDVVVGEIVRPCAIEQEGQRTLAVKFDG